MKLELPAVDTVVTKYIANIEQVTVTIILLESHYSTVIFIGDYKAIIGMLFLARKAVPMIAFH